MAKKLKCYHRWITDQCRQKGDETVAAEATAGVDKAVSMALRGYPTGEPHGGVKVHVEVWVEIPEDPDTELARLCGRGFS